MTHKYLRSKVSHDKDEEEDKKKRRLKVAHGGKTARLGRNRKYRDDGGGVGNATVPLTPAPTSTPPTFSPEHPSWERIPNGPEGSLPPAPTLSDEEFKARWGTSRKRGGSAKR